MKIKKRGADAWGDLIGREISFTWSDGWEDYWIHGVFEGTQPYAEDPRYMRYYILVDSGGVSVWENEEVEVEVHA